MSEAGDTSPQPGKTGQPKAGDRRRARALASADKARMQALTLAAFDEVGISVSRIDDHVAFSVERTARGKRGQGH